LLQLQLLVTIGSIDDCSNRKSAARRLRLILVGLDSLRVEAIAFDQTKRAFGFRFAI
jgi:hypothetical protein